MMNAAPLSGMINGFRAENLQDKRFARIHYVPASMNFMLISIPNPIMLLLLLSS